MENSSNRQVSFTQSIVLFYKNYFNFKGRSSRGAYWWWVLASFIIGFVIGFFEALSGFYDYENGYGVFSSIFNSINLIPGLALSVRRLHDIGKSGWWNLLIFTLIGIIPLIYWACKKGETETNKYGDDLEAGR